MKGPQGHRLRSWGRLEQASCGESCRVQHVGGAQRRRGGGEGGEGLESSCEMIQKKAQQHAQAEPFPRTEPREKISLSFYQAF